MTCDTPDIHTRVHPSLLSPFIPPFLSNTNPTTPAPTPTYQNPKRHLPPQDVMHHLLRRRLRTPKKVQKRRNKRNTKQQRLRHPRRFERHILVVGGEEDLGFLRVDSPGTIEKEGVRHDPVGVHGQHDGPVDIAAFEGVFDVHGSAALWWWWREGGRGRGRRVRESTTESSIERSTTTTTKPINLANPLTLPATCSPKPRPIP